MEHIPDDIKAMSELFRVLKSGGMAILQVPISLSLDVTFEDESVISSEDRERVFGQFDHVRVYAMDYVDRLKSVGFDVDVVDIDKISSSFVDTYSLISDEKLFVCRKK